MNTNNDYYWERNMIEDSANAARGAMKSEKQMVLETKKFMKYFNISMGIIAVVLVVLNFSAFFRDIPYSVQVILKCCLVLFVLVTCGFILYSFCKIRILLKAYDMGQKSNDFWVFVHCVSFTVFNIFLVIMLGLTET